MKDFIILSGISASFIFFAVYSAVRIDRLTQKVDNLVNENMKLNFRLYIAEKKQKIFNENLMTYGKKEI